MEEDVFESSRANAMAILNEECEALMRKAKWNLNTEQASFALLQTWKHFFKRHQSSPSRVNNNVSGRCRHRNLENSSSDGGRTVSVSLHLRNRPWKFSLDNLMTSLKPSRLMYTVLTALEVVFIFFVCIVAFFGTMVLHKPTQVFIARNTQDMIYPFMRGIRLASLPIIQVFPMITELYEESCLIANPNYLAMDDYECWPCEAVREVIDVTGFSNFSSAYYQNGVPFVVKDNKINEDPVNHIGKMYYENNQQLAAAYIDSNIPEVRNLEDLFNMLDSKDLLNQYSKLHIVWKINRVADARLLRKYFVKPYFIPTKTEVSIQHFLFVDNFNSPAYSMPSTEFVNVFLIQASGSRHILLFPTERCLRTCKVVAVLLRHGDVLYYNWLYWNPKSVPAESSSLSKFTHTDDSVSMTYVGSFY